MPAGAFLLRRGRAQLSPLLRAAFGPGQRVRDLYGPGGHHHALAVRAHDYLRGVHPRTAAAAPALPLLL